MFPPLHPCFAISQCAVRHRNPCYLSELLHNTHHPLTKSPFLLHMQKKRLWHQQISQTSEVRSPNHPPSPVCPTITVSGLQVGWKRCLASGWRIGGRHLGGFCVESLWWGEGDGGSEVLRFEVWGLRFEVWEQGRLRFGRVWVGGGWRGIWIFLGEELNVVDRLSGLDAMWIVDGVIWDEMRWDDMGWYGMGWNGMV